MLTFIPELRQYHAKPLTTDINTVIALHNTGTQICLVKLVDGRCGAKWADADGNEFETELPVDHFDYLCSRADKYTNIWFDFELDDTDENVLVELLEKYPQIKHV